MDKTQKEEFIKSLIKSVEIDLLSKIDRFPEEWDGIELRQIILDSFKQCVFPAYLKGKRKRDYINSVSIHNL